MWLCGQKLRHETNSIAMTAEVQITLLTYSFQLSYLGRATEEGVVDRSNSTHFVGGSYRHLVNHHTGYLADWHLLEVRYWAALLSAGIAPLSWGYLCGVAWLRK